MRASGREEDRRRINGGDGTVRIGGLDKLIVDKDASGLEIVLAVGGFEVHGLGSHGSS